MDPKAPKVCQKTTDKTKKRCSEKVGTGTSTLIRSTRPGSICSRSVLRKITKIGAQIDATTHQKSMPKQVPKKSMTIINNHTFSKCKNMAVHCKTNGFRRFSKLRALTEKVSANYQKWYQDPSKKDSNNYDITRGGEPHMCILFFLIIAS